MNMADDRIWSTKYQKETQALSKALQIITHLFTLQVEVQYPPRIWIL